MKVYVNSIFIHLDYYENFKIQIKYINYTLTTKKTNNSLFVLIFSLLDLLPKRKK